MSHDMVGPYRNEEFNKIIDGNISK
jgi:hypothetical protein